MLDFLKRTKKDEQGFFGLLMKENDAVGIIFKADSGKTQIIAKEAISYSNGWENLSEDMDELLFRLESQTKIKVTKTIFFVYSHFIDRSSGSIKKEYLHKIKQMVKNLELEPIGYIEPRDAIVKNYTDKEQMGLTAILIELDSNLLTFSVYKAGKDTLTKVMGRTDNVIQDILQILDEQKDNTLFPSRIILYNSGNVSPLAAKIVAYPWPPDFFVQPPRVEVIKESDLSDYLNNYFGSNLAGQTPVSVTAEPKTNSDAEKLGFVIGGDVSHKPAKTDKAVKPDRNEYQDDKRYQEEQPVGETEYLPKGKANPKKNLLNYSAITEMLARVTHSFAGKGMNWLLPIGIAAFVLSLLSVEYFLHRATLTLFYKPYKIDKDLPVVGIVGKGQGDVLTIRAASVSASLNTGIATTGKKTIGEKARGEVTLYNFDDKEKQYDKNTVLESGGQKFIIDDAVKVPASTLASDASAKLPGRIKAKITADSIGTEGNLAKGNRFKIDDLPSLTYFAINDTSLTGGSRKEIRTVSKNDLAALETAIIKEGKKNLKTEKDSGGQHEIAIDGLTEYSVQEPVYSKEVGEEAERVEMQAKVVATYFVYDNNQLQDMIKSKLANNLPDGFAFNNADLSYRITKAEKEVEKISIALAVKAEAGRKYDADEVKNVLKGKSIAEIDGILRNRFKSDGMKIDIRPHIFLLENRLPFFPRNISVNSASN